MESIVKCTDLCMNYGAQAALDGVNLELPSGKIIGLLGPNGSGKTTFLKILAGILTPTSGSAAICGMTPSAETKAIVSYLPDRTYFDRSMKISDYTALFSDFYADFDQDCARGMLADLGVPDNVKLGTLSKGTAEKVQLALVLARRAKLYLLDEPIGGVDPASRDFILKNILTSYAPHATVIISTHLIRDVEDILDGYIFLREGHVIGSGDVKQAREASGKTIDEMFKEVFRWY